ncbi:MAG: FAD-dependent oxidoreductase [Ferruginibacter sp.]
MNRDGATLSIWQDGIKNFEAEDIKISALTYDVAIVGGGMTGISTALELQKAGFNCIVLEAQTLGFGTTSGTTAHLNTLLDLTYDEIESKFGEENSKLVLQSTLGAINLIRTNMRKYNIDCEFTDKKGFQFAVNDEQCKMLIANYESSIKAGCSVTYVKEIPINIAFIKALAFEDQAQFHPTKYLLGIAEVFEKNGGTILQQCRVTGVDKKENDLLQIETDKGNYSARNLVYATHVPPGVNILHFRCAPYRSYVLGFTLRDANYPDGLVYDFEDPYHYYRTQEIAGQKYVIAGGEDHKTGEEADTESRYKNLEKYFRQHFNIDKITYRWSSQYFQSADGLAYIGHLPGNPENVYVATGYGGNGMIFSNIAAVLLTSLIKTGQHAYKELYNPSRIKPVAGFNNFVKEAADVVSKLTEKIIGAPKIKELDEIKSDEGKVVKYEGDSIAVYKDKNNLLHTVSSACTHIKCNIAWNNTELVWECPCHGSRFTMDGEMITAPARKDLEKIKFSEE